MKHPKTNKEQIYIAEIKTKSPYGYVSPHSFHELMESAITYGDWISVHTNALWGGDYEAISFVYRNTHKPILAKGLHSTNDDIKRSLDHGANYVLVVDPAMYRFEDFEHTDKLLFEFSDVKLAMQQLRKSMPKSVVVNSRSLNSGYRKPMVDFKELKQAGLKWVCQASHIHSYHDVSPDADAFIVGEHMMFFNSCIENRPPVYDGMMKG